MTRKKKILLVEDEVVIAMDLESSLRSYGYEITGYTSRGEDVFRILDSGKPDLIIMDIKLDGELDGVQTAELINEQYNIPIIFLTSYSNIKLIERAKKTGPFGYIVKPYDDRELHTNIEIALYKHETEKRLKESEKKYRELSESIQQIILECDMKGVFRYLNQPGMQFLGISSGELARGIAITDFIQADSFEEIKNRITNHHTITSQSANRQHKLISKLGKQYFVEEYLSPIYENETITGFRGILIDITNTRLKDQLTYILDQATGFYTEVRSDLTGLMNLLLRETGKLFDHIECIYYNEYDANNKTFRRHEKNVIRQREFDKGYSEIIVSTNKPLYMRGQELWKFIHEKQIPILSKKPASWAGFPIRIDKSVKGVFAFKSYSNEQALTRSEYESLSVFFNNINILLERVNHLKEIKIREEKYRLLVNSINEGLIQTDLDNNIIFVNDQMCAITGYTRDELVNHNALDILNKNENGIDLLYQFTGDRKKGGSSQFDLNITSKSGEIKNFIVSGSSFRNTQGEIKGTLATFFDVTEKHEHLKLIRESEQVFKDVAKNVPGVVFRFNVRPDGSTYFSYLSEKVGEIFKIDININSELRELAEHVHQEDRETFLSSIQTAINTAAEWRYEGRIISRDTEIKWFEGKSTPMKVGEELVFNGILIDITVRKKVVEAIINSKMEMECILASLPDSFIIIDRRGIIRRSDLKRNEKILTEIIPSENNHVNSVFNPEFAQLLYNSVETCLQTGVMNATEWQMLAKKETHWFEIRFVPFNTDSALTVIRNVTGIKKNILETQKFFNITEQSNDLIMITDSKGRIEYVNPTFTEVTGHQLKDIKGKSPSFFKSNKHTPAFYTAMWKKILAGDRFQGEFYNLKKNGELYLEQKIISPLLNEDKKVTHFISTGRDITEERKREKKIEAYQRFEKKLEKKEQKNRTLSIIQGQENERIRIAREIHDGLGQMLTVAKANLESLKPTGPNKAENRNKYHLVTTIVAEIIQESRRISHNLSPSGLYEFGLHAVLVSFVKRINANLKGITIEYKSNLNHIRFKNEIEINIYRIVQETVQNALKHSGGDLISLSLRHDIKGLTLTVSDNGQGFDLKNTRTGHKHVNGLRNIEERAKVIDARLTIISSPGNGTVLELFLKNKKNNYDKNLPC